MKVVISLMCVLALLINACTSTPARPASAPVKIIFDSDLGPDYDDVGALAFLHAMADSGKAEILATIASNKDELVAPAIDVINTYFGRPDLPLGGPKSAGVSINSPYHWADTLIARYPHRLRSTDEAPDAVKVYRKILSAQPDTSVTIVTVGFLTNMSNLLSSAADDISPLSGKELISKKVKRLVSMAGRFPAGKEFNVYMDSLASIHVFNEWPGKITFTGWEIGSVIFTGLKLIHSGIEHSPVKDVFSISIPLSDEDRNGRMSWDETGVLIGVYGTQGFFDTVRGKIIVNPDGSNSWENDPAGNQSYVVQKMPPEEMAAFIEARMMHLPARK
jgi:inosine-uridine nucleoside N-ribohydrolase